MANSNTSALERTAKLLDAIARDPDGRGPNGEHYSQGVYLEYAGPNTGDPCGCIAGLAVLHERFEGDVLAAIRHYHRIARAAGDKVKPYSEELASHANIMAIENDGAAVLGLARDKASEIFSYPEFEPDAADAARACRRLIADPTCDPWDFEPGTPS